MSATTAPQAPTRTNLDLGMVFKEGWRLFVKDLGPILGGFLVATALGVVTLGILLGPLYAGLYRMVVARVRDGEQPRVGDVFNCLDRFWAFLGAGLALAILIALASLTIVGGFILATIWLYVFPVMVDRGVGLGEAMRISKDLVMENGFWQHLALLVIFVVVNAVIGWPLALLTAPFMLAIVGVAYFVAAGKADKVSQA